MSPAKGKGRGFSTLKFLISLLFFQNSTVGAQKINPDGTKVYEEDEEILRIPVALAMVKLLQKTSKQLLNSHLPRCRMLYYVVYEIPC